MIAFSQEGEDLILNRIFSGKHQGFYIDIGAHHPVRFSNTYLFYKMGWRGINIDAMPGSMKPFQKHRSRDINLEVPINSTSTEIDFYIFNDPALNGFSKELSLKRDSESEIFKIEKTLKLKTYRLDEILNKHLPKNQPIDFMSVDVEGLDLEVLKSNNWEKYRP
jgi:FkbM family methyltransferase